MSAVFSGSSPIHSLTTPLLSDYNRLEDALETVDLSHRTPRAGHGGLTGKTISVGDGQQRMETTGGADKAKNAFKIIGKVLGGLIALPVVIPLGIAVGGLALAVKAINFLPRLINNNMLEPRAETAYKMANADAVREMLAKGHLPPPLGPEQAPRRCKACSLIDRCQPHATYAGVAAARAALFDPDA